MKIAPVSPVALLAAALWISPVALGGQDLLWEVPQPQATFYGTNDSVKYEGTFNADKEVADDIEATGSITAISVPGHGCGSCSPADVEGVNVRLYEWTDQGPGVLQQERFVPAGSDFTWDGVNPYGLSITLNDPIAVNGWHFISVQVVFGDTGGNWRFKQANRFNPINQTLYERDNLAGGVWEPHESIGNPAEADFAISIYGEAAPTAPVIASVSKTTVTGSDRIFVNGSAFGSPGNGELLVNGIPAIVTQWSSTKIVGYVPEGVAPGDAELTVVNLGVSSDPLPITIIPREPVGRVKWVFEGEGDYTIFAPAVGPDGTIYFDDIDGHLYAVSDDGALLWIVDSLLGQQGNGTESSVSVGSDGTVYVGTNPLGPTVEIVAFNPDGSHKWTFTAPHALTWVAGPDVGPDGRIYGALSAAQFLGQSYDVLALNPDGSVAWTSAADPLVFEDAAGGFELAFAPSEPGGEIDQLLFTADLYAFETFGRVYGFDLADGTQNFAEVMNPAGPGTTLGNCQLAADVNTGAFYGFEFNGIGGGGFGLQAFNADGDRAWHFDPGIASGVTDPAVGPDGVIYFGWDLGRLTAVSPDGNELWTNFEPVMYGGPMPSPTAPMLLAAGREGFSEPSFVEARDTATGDLLWSQGIVDDDGDDVSTYTRPRFTPNGQTAYFAALELPITPTSTYRIFAVDTTLDDAPTLGDLNADGSVNVSDLLLLLGAWGNCVNPGDCPTDLNGDEMVNVLDLLMLLTEWG